MSQKYPGGFITKSPVAPTALVAKGVWTLDQAMQLKKQGLWPSFTVPGAPTIGTATATGSTTATVAFTAPASNGGTAITSYTATSSPGGITGTLSQAGSGTITVTGLTTNTSYTFTVTATNAVGTGPASAASNSVTPVLQVGDAYAGGFFTGQIDQSGTIYNLVVGPKSSAQTQNVWKTTNTNTAGTDSVIDGPTNSSNMNNASHPLAQFCEAVTAGGFTDWYMPAKNELEVCYYNLKPTIEENVTNDGTNPNAVPARTSDYTTAVPPQTSVSTFQDQGAEAFDASYYFSSTQNSALSAWAQRFGNGTQDGPEKGNSYRARAVRRILA